MAMKNNNYDREFDKFKEVDGETTVRVYVVNPSGGGGSSRIMKANVVTGASFAGSPKKYIVTFTDDMPSASYVITISGTDSRNYTYEAVTVSGFTINTNATTAIGGSVSWFVTVTGETA